MANLFAELKRRHIYRLAAERRAERRLAAILAADVAGYSRLMGQDEVGTLRALSAARATLSRLITEHGGRVVNTVGDSALAEFPSVVDAVQCAIAVQDKLADESALPGEGSHLQFRIAVHVGDVMPSGRDIFGDGINVCARLQELAEPGGICISGAAYQYVRKALKVAFDDLGERTLKNIDEPVRAFAIRGTKGAEQSRPDLEVFVAPAPAKAKARRLGWVAAGGLAAAMALFLLYPFISQTGTTAQQESAGPEGAIAIAVLPFANLSGDPNEEFFSDGMTEEITAALARIPDLPVVARTSAFQFKGQNQNVKTIGGELGATHLIEGSVRKVGNRVRITAQLVRAGDGLNLWSENYDRQLTDIFVIQDDIARAIAAALRMPLGLRTGENPVTSRTQDPTSYDDYLRARALVRQRGYDRIMEAIKLLEDIVARDPNFSSAWALLAEAYALVPPNSPERRALQQTGRLEAARQLVQSAFEKAERSAREAIRLDPRSAAGYAALARAYGFEGRWAQSEDAYKQALSLDPDQPDNLASYVLTLGQIGRLRDAVVNAERLRRLEPLISIVATRSADALNQVGEYAAAASILEALPPGSGNGFNRNIYLAEAYAGQGRFNDAADTLLLSTTQLATRQAIEQAAQVLRTASATAAAPRSPSPVPVLDPLFVFIYPYVGTFDRILDPYENAVAQGLVGATLGLWRPSFAPVRKTARFKSFVLKIGLVDYWRARGWADVCRPVGADDFECS